MQSTSLVSLHTYEDKIFTSRLPQRLLNLLRLLKIERYRKNTGFMKCVVSCHESDQILQCFVCKMKQYIDMKTSLKIYLTSALNIIY